MKRCEGFLDSVPDGLLVADTDGRIQLVNGYLEAQFGYGRDELLGEPVETLLPERYRDEHARARERYGESADGSPTDAALTLYARRKDGSEFPVRIGLSRMRVGGQTEVVESIRDQSPEESARTTGTESDHHEREYQFQRLVDGVEEHAIFLLAPDGLVTTWNDGARAINGYAREEILGEHVSVFYTDEDCEAGVPEQTLERARTHGSVVDEGWRIRKDGSRFWASVTITAIDEDGELQVYAEVTRDMTAKREHEEELQRERDLVERIIQTSPIGIGVLSPTGELLQVNDRAAEIFGTPRRWRDYQLGELPVYDELGVRIPREQTAFRQVLETGDAVLDRTVEVECADGDRRWLVVHSAPLTDDDRTVEGVVVVTEDVTVFKEYERELTRQNVRLEEFASVVSHDLRNPLLVARTSLDLARRSQAAADFDRIEAAHERMAALIYDMLTLARTGHPVEETTPVDLASAVELAWEAVQSDDATLAVSVDGYSVEADRARLRQLLENLLMNAVVHGGSDVTVSVGLLGDEPGFYVADDGPGLPSGTETEIFDHGYSTSDEGFGFGLSVVRDVADAHGWTVEPTESEAGGARFDVLLAKASQPQSLGRRSSQSTE